MKKLLTGMRSENVSMETNQPCRQKLTSVFWIGLMLSAIICRQGLAQCSVIPVTSSILVNGLANKPICSGSTLYVTLTANFTEEATYTITYPGGSRSFLYESDGHYASGITVTLGTITTSLAYKITAVASGCTSVVTLVNQTLTVASSNASLTLTSSIPDPSKACSNEGIVLTVHAVGVSYTWHTSPSIDQTITGSTFKPTMTASYSVTGTESTCGTTFSPPAINVTYNTSPAAPSFSASTNLCGAKTLTHGSAPSGETWYWQGASSTGTDQSATASATTYSAATAGTSNYYLRSMSSAGCWSTATGASVPVNYSPAAPSIPIATINTCNNKTLTKGTPPANTGWYWQGTNSAQQDYTSATATSPTYTASATGTYYLSARSTAGCWSGATGVNVATSPVDITLSTYDNVNTIVQATHSIRLTPGFTVSAGSTLDARIAITAECTDWFNWQQQIGYDQNGQPLANSKVYLDGFGNTMQSQSIDYLNNKVWVSQPLYDNLVKAAASTLPAPIGETDFIYKSGFVQNTSGQIYSASDFDATATINSPNAVGNQLGTLGWYYSSNNTLEPQTPATSYPYARSYTPPGPDPVSAKAAGAGDPYKMGSGHESKSDRYLINTATELTNYYALQPSFSNSTASQTGGYKYISTDANGKRTATFVDMNGRTLASALVTNVNTTTTPVTVTYDNNTWSYTYYNDAGQVVATVPPNGVNVSVTTTPNFVTHYYYDPLGRLVKTTSPDEGTSQFVYSTDGKIRFSQNQEQNIANPPRFSYTNYDYLGRLIESGEYTQTPGTSYIFEPTSTATPAANSVLKIVDNVGYGGTAGNVETAACSDVTQIYYDSQPADFVADAYGHTVQTYLYGQVAKTSNMNSTTWYSYDEFGQLAWTMQNIVVPGSVATPGKKTVDYAYDYYGNVTQVTYQKGQSDQFIHYYTYDKNQDLISVSTSTDGTTKKVQAAYYYYLHGPLKRVELGGNIQGIDYVYNIDGSLKLINHPDPALDPGGDGLSGAHSGFQKDVFGLALDYNSSDYSGTNYNPGSFSPSGYADQYDGTVKSQRWHSQTDSHVPRAYAYTYDKLNQLSTADWGSVTGGSGVYAFTKSSVSAYQENIGSYDNNGNINSLLRKSNTGSNLANFAYTYAPNTNQLKTVTDNGNALLGYLYNTIGQMTQQTEGSKTMKVNYNAYGLVKNTQDASNNLLVSYDYDDRGNRVKKTTYNAGVAQYATFYVSDAGGNVLSIYEQDIANTGQLLQTELPIYGAGRVATYKPQEAATFYEVTDHLGNVRGVLASPGPPAYIYMATMEDNGQVGAVTNPRTPESRYFSNIATTAVTDQYMNHTPPLPNATLPNETMANPTSSSYVYWKSGSVDPSTHSIGPAISLTVQPGDKVDMSVYAKFKIKGSNYTRPGIQTAMATLLGSNFVSAGAGLEVATTSTQIFSNGLSNLLGAAETGNDVNTLPYAYLYYILYDREFNYVTSGWHRVKSTGGFAEGNQAISKFDTLQISSVNITNPGYMYIFVSNESEDTQVWFDDLTINYTRNNVVAGADYYPFGLAMDTRSITREDYRYGYQGQFSEKDKETGYNAFQLRMYDPRIGRWVSPDPYGQFASPYVAMGNNPVMTYDVDGGLAGPGCPECGFGKLDFESGFDGAGDGEAAETRPIQNKLLGAPVTHLGNPEIWDIPRREPGSGNWRVTTLSKGLSSIPSPEATLSSYIPSAESVQMALGLAGLIPGVQTVAGIAEAGVAIYRGDYWGAGFAVAGAIPVVGYIAKARSLKWTHHIIPRQLFNELNLAQYGFNLDHVKNLVDLPFPFHAYHPSYTRYVRNEISQLKIVTLDKLIDIQTEMSKQIGRIHGSGYKKLNQYYKDLGF